MLEQVGAVVLEERSTARPLSASETDELLAQVETVVLLRGRAVVELPAAEMRADDLRGPTGKIRAPLVRVGATLLAGFLPERLERLLRARPDQRARPKTASRKAKSKAESRSRS